MQRYSNKIVPTQYQIYCIQLFMPKYSEDKLSMEKKEHFK